MHEDVRKGRLLIVEDRVNVVNELAHKLEADGYEIVGFAQTTDEAIEAAIELEPDVVVIDVDYDDHDTDEMGAAESITRLCGSKVIFLTGAKEPEAWIRAHDTSTYAFIEKPPDVGDLELLLDGMIYGLTHGGAPRT